jgi:hypothetical protein
VELLGPEEIKNLTDLKNLLQGKTLKQLIETFTNKEEDYLSKQKELKEEINNLQDKVIANNQAY